MTDLGITVIGRVLAYRKLEVGGRVEAGRF